MKCPVCAQSLQPVKFNETTVDVCHPGCGGIWFDQFELQRFGQPHVPAPNPLLKVQPHPELVVPRVAKRPCPRCDGIWLKRRLFNPKSLVEIDECGGCGGIWLDAGELAKIREELREPTHTRVEISVSILSYLATGSQS